MNIPIVVINEEKYNKNKDKREGCFENIYLSGSDVTDYEILEDLKVR